GVGRPGRAGGIEPRRLVEIAVPSGVVAAAGRARGVEVGEGLRLRRRRAAEALGLAELAQRAGRLARPREEVAERGVGDAIARVLGDRPAQRPDRRLGAPGRNLGEALLAGGVAGAGPEPPAPPEED